MATAKKRRKSSTTSRILKYVKAHPSAPAKEVAVACGTTVNYVYAVQYKARAEKYKARVEEYKAQAEEDKVKGNGDAYDNVNGEWEAVSITMSDDPADPADSTDAMLAERGERYGTFVRQAEIAVRLKAILAEYHVEGGIDLAYDQMESLHMICNKLGRIINGDPDYSDSWHDIAGYAKLVANRLDGKVV